MARANDSTRVSTLAAMAPREAAFRRISVRIRPMLAREFSATQHSRDRVLAQLQG
jgi:hypothetical protein